MCFKLLLLCPQIENKAWEWSYGKYDEQEFTGLNIVWVGTILDGIFWIAIIRVGIFWVGIFQVGVILGGSFPGGSYPGWELPEWELSWVGIFFGGGFPGGNCPGGIIRVAIFWVGVFLVPCDALKQISHTKNCTQGFIVLNFLFGQIAVKLRNSQIFENFQLWYRLNYSNFFQVFGPIFEKS